MSYEYLNTRVRVMLARLLAPQQFLALLELRELPQLITALGDTDYAPELERSSVEFSGYELIENALIAHGQRVFQKLLTIAPEGPRQLLEIVLERFEVFNLKTIVRGLHAGAPAKEVARSLYPSLLFSQTFYTELLQRGTLRDMLDYLLSTGNRYYKPLAAIFPEYERTGKLALLEHALDSFYFANARERLREYADENAKIIQDALDTETDILNLVYALRVVAAGVRSPERERYILAGGRLSTEAVRELLNAADLDDLLKKVRRTPYGKALAAEAELSITRLQGRLENLLYRELCRLERGRFFDIHMAISYIWRKSAEITNIRVIASGLTRRASRAQIEEHLIPLEVFA
jgi:V/A-type H+-transporting ATPase subunit C